MKWLHRWLNPHCPHCKEDKERELYNPIEEFLKGEIVRLQLENKFLLERLLLNPGPVKEPETEHKVFNPIPMSHNRTWSVKAQMLEEESRAKARKMNEVKEENKIESLEKELGIENA